MLASLSSPSPQTPPAYPRSSQKTRAPFGMDSRSNRKIIRPTKHITRACTGCRQRKTKCDGARPQCANCRLHNQECMMPQQVDKRTVPSKERYSRLEQYTQLLESVLLQNGVPLPPQLDNYSAPDYIINPNPIIQTPVSHDDSSWGETSDRAISALPVPLDDTDSDLNVLGERFGSLQLADDGQVRFFGATSNLHIQHVGPFSLTDSKIRSVYGKEREILRQGGFNDPVPQELEDHLLRLYFCWENPNIPVVDQDIYYTERANYRATGRPTHRYSELLTNAMCAVGAALTRRHPRGLPESLAEFFSSRAKALLDVETDAPGLCTVQALVILSGVEAFLTRDARGWLYSGMAMRLAIDLGLHLKPSASIRRGLLDATEMRLRRIIFWGAYIHDRMWSFYVGRPESLDEKHIFVDPLRAIDVAQTTAPLWQPYIDETNSPNPPGLPSLLGEVAQYTVSLCRKMSHIRRVLYNSPYPDGSEIKSLHGAARKLRDDLLSWAESLPSSIALRDGEQQPLRPPHVLQLHMQYYAILVVIDRPFTYGRYQRLPGLTPADMEESHTACTNAAVSLVNLLQTYRSHHGARQVNIHTVHLVFTAALVHIHNVYFAPCEAVRTAARRFLQTSCQVLSEIGQAYRNALRALEIITSIKSELARSEGNRSRPDSHHEYNSALNKRARLDPSNTPPVRSSVGPDTGAQLLGAPAMEGLDMLEECLDISPSTTLLASDSLFTETWGWISPPDSLSTS